MGQGREVRRRQGRLIAGNVGPTFHNLAFRGSRQPVYVAAGIGSKLPLTSNHHHGGVCRGGPN
jgi:hypothetical protein